jgi:hypothetical protein
MSRDVLNITTSNDYDFFHHARRRQRQPKPNNIQQ